MHIAKVDVVGIGHPHRVGERLLHVGDTVTVIVRDGEIAGVIDFERRCVLAFAALLFRLQRVKLPVRYILQFDFRADVVLARELVHKAGDGGVRNQDAGLSERVGGPDIGEGAAASFDPKAGILRVPGAMWVGVCAVSGVVGIETRAVRTVGTVAAQKADVVDKRVFARVPQKADSAGVEAAGEDAEAGHYVGAAGRREQERPGRIGAFKRRCAVGEIELRGAGVQADQNGIGAKRKRVVEQIAPAGEIEHRVARRLPCCRATVSSVTPSPLTPRL